MEKELLFSVTKKDFEFDYFSGTGKGGQNRNRHKNCCRCFHRPSDSMGISKEERSKEQNTKKAWNRCVASESFQKWLKLEIMRATSDAAELEAKVDKEMENVKIEVMKEGKWKIQE